MQNLCFKPRPGGKTVQLVRHAYDPASKRSRTLTVGTLDLRADPALFPIGLTLRPGHYLDEAEQQKAEDYLHTHADPASHAQRETLVARIRQELNDAAAAQGEDSLEQCAQAIATLTQALPQLAQKEIEHGNTPWQSLRPRYLALAEAWKALVGAAQQAGIAKQYKRGNPRSEDDI